MNLKNRMRWVFFILALVVATLAVPSAVQAGSAPAADVTTGETESSSSHVIVFQISSGGATYAVKLGGSSQHALVTAAALGGAGIKYDAVDKRVISWR
jgi:hypothetical protein